MRIVSCCGREAGLGPLPLYSRDAVSSYTGLISSIHDGSVTAAIALILWDEQVVQKALPLSESADYVHLDQAPAQGRFEWPKAVHPRLMSVANSMGHSA